MYKIGEGITNYLERKIKQAIEDSEVYLTLLKSSILGAFGEPFADLVDHYMGKKYGVALYMLRESIETVNNLNIEKIISILRQNQYKFTDMDDVKFISDLITTLKDFSKLNDVFIQMLEIEYSSIIELLKCAKEFKKKLGNHQNCKTDDLRIYGYACELTRYYTMCLERNSSNIDQEIYKIIVEDTGFEGCVSYTNQFKDSIILPLGMWKKFKKEILSSKELFALSLIAQKIEQFELLPITVSNIKACNAIASYYEDGRVDNDKEAINLYFTELEREKNLKELEEKNKKALEEQREQFNFVVNLIKKSMDDQKNAMVKIAQCYSNVEKKHAEMYNELVDEYNGLVDEYNDTLDQIKKIKEELQ